ncbi:MAG: hypothetical protein Q7T26_10860 [Dehalococcoidia bacterium]|nr:hypothetical protein [Dehalococcoidia bacterium]
MGGRLLGGQGGRGLRRRASRSAGIEFTLLTLIHWILANGLIVVGLPPQRARTAWNCRMETSGSYYGATGSGAVNADDVEQARALGERVARVAVRLARKRD